jgi:hypothetical protein
VRVVQRLLVLEGAAAAVVLRKLQRGLGELLCCYHRCILLLELPVAPRLPGCGRSGEAGEGQQHRRQRRRDPPHSLV